MYAEIFLRYLHCMKCEDLHLGFEHRLSSLSYVYKAYTMPLFMYIYIYTYIHGAFNKFPDFLAQAFKLSYTWIFNVLMLYILWDYWPIFMISGSNEQLQHELEYTLLNPDCHAWWISKMQSDSLEERYAMKLCFQLGKKATETHGMRQTAFWASCMNRASVFEWRKRFKESKESGRDDERFGRSKEVNTPQLIGQRVRIRVTMMRF